MDKAIAKLQMERAERIIELLENADGKKLELEDLDQLISGIYGHADEIRRYLAGLAQ